jgi:hypothetical protein
MRTPKVHDTSSDDPAQWKWLLTQTWRSPEPTKLEGPAVLAKMKEKAKHFASPFREAFLSIPDEAPVWHNRLSNWPTKPWDSRGGRITLVGDAAHPMAFRTYCIFWGAAPGSETHQSLFADDIWTDRGQGLQNAVTDAASFLEYVREMKEPTREELVGAVKKYEEELWPRGEEAVLASEENTNMVHDCDDMLKSQLYVGGMDRHVAKV